MKILRVIIVLVPFVFTGLSFSEYYQWQDENGAWHFTETPPPSNTSFDTKQTIDSSSSGTEEADTAPASDAKPMQVIPHSSEKDDNNENKPEHVMGNPSLLEQRRNFYAPVDSGAMVIERLKLAPREKKRISITASQKSYVGYYTDIPNEDRAKCGYCIKLKQEGVRTSVESPSGGQDLMPINGTINFFIENLASFPVEVEVYRQ